MSLEFHDILTRITVRRPVDEKDGFVNVRLFAPCVDEAVDEAVRCAFRRARAAAAKECVCDHQGI